MEHKIVRGGGEYLPFARSQIRRLRATGQSYAAQKYLIGGVTVSVRIVGEDEFISIEGGTPEILSGVVKDGEIVNIPADPGPPEVPAYDTLRAFKPTQNCWDTVLRKNPDKPVTAFNDEKKLAKAGTQYANLAASMFSGLMAKAVQVLMGMGKEVKYDYHASRCHGITTDDSGKLWLVEISAANGIIAKRLTMSPLANNSAEPNDAVRACRDTFKGVPDGRAFPTDLDAAIEDGSVLRLVTVEAMDPYFSTLAFHEDLGWTFNDSGTEAYNTCYKVFGDGAVNSYLYKITFAFTDDSKTATLELVEQGALNTVAPYGSVIPFTFDGYSYVPSRELPLFTPDPVGSAPLLACHIGGVLDVVRCVTTGISTSSGRDPAYTEFINGNFAPEATYYFYSGIFGGKRAVGTALQSRPYGNASRSVVTRILQESVSYTTTEFGSTHTVTYNSAVYRAETTGPNTAGLLCWLKGCRDGYASMTKETGVGVSIAHYGVQGVNRSDTGGNTDSGFSLTAHPEFSAPAFAISDFVYDYTGPPGGEGYDFIAWSGDGPTGNGNVLGYERTTSTAVAKMEIATRYAPNQPITNSDYLGGFADRYGVLRASTFGESAHQAFTVPSYTYYPSGSPSPVDAGGYRLTGPLLDSEAGGIDHTFNFIGYINVPPT